MPWMTHLWNTVPAFQNRSLSQITIPGTHDTGCYINHQVNFGSRTQTQTVANQLAGGIRYFDIRPYQANRLSGGYSFWTYHGPSYTGGQLSAPGILQDVANYMANVLVPGDRELVILNISHFKSFGNADHQALIGQIVAALGPHLVPYTQAQIDLFNAPYWQLLAAPAVGGGPPVPDGGGGPPGGTAFASRVAILYDGALDQAVEAYVQNSLAGAGGIAPLPAGFFVLSPKYPAAPNPIQLFDQYANVVGVGDLQVDQLAKLRGRRSYPYDPSVPQTWGGAAGYWPDNAVGGVVSTLHLFSWTLTPQPIVRDPVTAARWSNPALPVFFSNAVSGWAGANGHYDPAADPQINIVYVDDYASHTYLSPLGGASPYHNLALPVAIAARLNDGPVWPMTW
jgi:hypothetical protein